MNINDNREIIERTETGYVIACAVCGGRFESKRHDASYCSSTCRARVHRQRGELDKQHAAAAAAVAELIQMLPRRPLPMVDSKTRAQSALESIRNDINRALSRLEIE